MGCEGLPVPLFLLCLLAGLWLGRAPRVLRPEGEGPLPPWVGWLPVFSAHSALRTVFCLYPAIFPLANMKWVVVGSGMNPDGSFGSGLKFPHLIGCFRHIAKNATVTAFYSSLMTKKAGLGCGGCAHIS